MPMDPCFLSLRHFVICNKFNSFSCFCIEFLSGVHYSFPFVVKTTTPLLHIKVWLPVPLCAVKTVKGDFRFCWTITPNVGQTHKENPNLVRILYMVLYIEWYIQTVQQITWTLIHKNQFTSLCRGQKPASKCIRLVYEILVICRALQALYTPQRCELMKTKTNNTNSSYRIFIVCRSPVSPIFWARILLIDFCLSRVCAH